MPLLLNSDLDVSSFLISSSIKLTHMSPINSAHCRMNHGLKSRSASSLSSDGHNHSPINSPVNPPVLPPPPAAVQDDLDCWLAGRSLQRSVSQQQTTSSSSHHHHHLHYLCCQTTTTVREILYLDPNDSIKSTTIRITSTPFYFIFPLNSSAICYSRGQRRRLFVP